LTLVWRVERFSLVGIAYIFCASQRKALKSQDLTYTDTVYSYLSNFFRIPMGEVKQTVIPNYMKFVLGGCAGMAATMCVQPLDLIKTRMQMSGVGVGHSGYRNSFHALTSVISNEGFFSIYSGYVLLVWF
ncbi:solute carrier family 25 (mitochondrial oxoglutarate transporter), member 11, partial [Paragonimus westermani]